MSIDLLDSCGSVDTLPSWFVWRVRVITYYVEGLISQEDYDFLNNLLQDRFEELVYNGGAAK